MTVRAGNFFTDPWPVDCDVHLLSNVLHDWGLAEVRDLLARSHEALPADGLIVIHEAFINADKTGPKAVAEYSARQIKQSVVGTGAANKVQVQHMVRVLLKLSSAPQEDAADALAAALCHAHTQHSMINMAGARSVHRRRLR